MKKIITVLIILGFAASASGKNVFMCKKIHWQKDRVYAVRAAIHRGTHIILPERIIGKPVPGNRDAWNIEGQGTHLFVKPNAKEREVAETTVTVVGESNTSYDFILVRVNSNPDYLVRVTRDGEMIQGNEIGEYRNRDEKINQLLQQRIGELESRLQEADRKGRQAAEETLQKYRSHIYTGYKWSKGSGFIGKHIISDVWDDGRFTFIRVFEDNKGLLTVAANVDGEKEFIEYDYDSGNKIYKLSGIFPKLNLKYGKSKIEVERKDSKTSGGY